MPEQHAQFLMAKLKVAFQSTARLDEMMKKIFAGDALSDFALHANIFIGIAGFTDDFAADVKRIFDKAKEVLSSLDKYIRDEAPFRALSEFDFTEYVFTTLHQKFDNLTEFDNAVQKYLAENLSW